MKDRKPLVSIIMPVYKTGLYVKETIESVINQTYKNLELICINDETPDDAFEICRDYQQKYKWIRLIENQKNSGLEFTRNRGLEVMKGDFVMFLDSDDTISKDMVEKMIALALEYDSELVMSGYSMVIDNREEPVVLDKNLNIPKIMDMDVFSELLLEPIEWKMLSCVGTKIYKTSLIKQNNLYFDNRFKYNEDGGFILSYLKLCTSVSYINEPFYKYTIRNSGSIMSSYRPNMFDSIIKVNELLRDVLVSNHVFENKSELFYRKMMFIVIDSLRNEVSFGCRRSFFSTFKTIINYEDCNNMINVLLSSKCISIKYKILLILIRYRLSLILYIFFKL